MTISKAIQTWLSNYDRLQFVETDRLEADPESYGLYKQPTFEEIAYIDGSALRTDYYYFVARENAQLQQDREENHSFLEALEEWIESEVEAGNPPKIIGFEEIGIANSFYLQDESEEEAVYQIGIYVTYLRRNNNGR